MKIQHYIKRIKELEQENAELKNNQEDILRHQQEEIERIRKSKEVIHSHRERRHDEFPYGKRQGICDDCGREAIETNCISHGRMGSIYYYKCSCGNTFEHVESCR